MAQVTVIAQRDDLPQGSASRAVAGLVAALTLHALNHAISAADVGVGTDPTKVKITNEFIYTITGQILRMDVSGADVYDLTGLTVVPPNHYQRYFFLADRDENVKVQEAVPALLLANVALSNLSPNPYAATVEMLNAVPGWACIGVAGIHVAADAPAPGFTPGVDALDGALIDSSEFINGFDGTVLLPAVGDNTQTRIIGAD